jgi:non-ribosomal peptide synthetase component F
LDKLVHELVEAQVRRSPESLAVICPALAHDPSVGPIHSLTYHQLNQRANQLAHYLRFLGCTSETLVPILLSRTPRFVIALLGILKAGGVCVPVDPSYPKQRLLFTLEQSEATIILTEKALKDKLPESYSHATVVVVDDPDNIEALDVGNTNNLVSISVASHLAYVLYTSGSTGQPKGVMLPHAALVNYITWHIPYYEMTAADRHAHYSSLAFDASMAETWPTLAIGASLWQVRSPFNRVACAAHV